MGSVDGDHGEVHGPSRRENERILVSVRVRPLNEKEAARRELIDWECINDTTIVHKNNLSPERTVYPTSYTFDRVFRPNCSTRQVYEEGAKSVVLSAVGGINSSVFAYGQTSSGKTFTMTGITEYTMADVFEYIQKHKERDFHLKFSAMEIYNESVRDLLTADNSPLRLLDDPERGTVVEKLTEETLRDWNHFQDLLAICEAQRQIGETFLNEVSSRSHQILRLTIESSTREYLGKNHSGTLAATLNFVDLAGSERASQALSAGSRLKEGSHINRSLLTLGTVIRKLSKGGIGHVPYRDSKLTRILQSSLGGNARTAVICTMSPARSYSEQSRNTLLFASCAKEVTTNAHVNVVMSDKALVKHLQRELVRLETELRSASPSVIADANNLLRVKDSKIEELERRVNELTQQLNLALSQIHELQQGSGDRTPIVWEEDDYLYPKLHVRQASDISTSNETTVTDHHFFIENSPASETLQSPDRHSGLSYDENDSISDFDENLPPSSPFSRMFIETPSDASTPVLIQTPKVIGNGNHRIHRLIADPTTNLSEVDPYLVPSESVAQTPNSFLSDTRNMTEEQNDDDFETRLEQVSNEQGGQSPYFVEFDPYQVCDEFGGLTPSSFGVDQCDISEEVAEKPSIDSHQTKVNGKEIDNHVEDYCKEVQCIETEKVQRTPLSLEEETKSSSPSHEIYDNGWRTNDEHKQEDVHCKATTSCQDLNAQFGKQENDKFIELKNVNCVKSPRLEDTSITSPTSVEKIKYETTNDIAEGEEEFVVRVENIHRTLSALRYNTSDVDPQIPTGDIVVDEDETPVTDVEVSDEIDCIEKYTSPAETMEISKPSSVDQPQLSDDKAEETHRKSNDSIKLTKDVIKHTKDVGLNPQDDLDTNSPWPSDSKRLQMEIIDLWDVCNISLVHRTCFFLLFMKGGQGQADVIYLEVERRRLSCIKDAFAWGNAIDLDNNKLTPGSSIRSLHHERFMLARLMKRRLSSQERIDLYVKWGINLDTKRRRSQLAQCLWVDTTDTNHIEESANIVAKLVKFSEPQVPKEVFGLNLMTNQGRRRSSFGWKSSPNLNY
ncbi:hypothetical protein RND81_11G231700 [Saponaria officinalis]|uniref:Kinesin motor domain-containing protein n=2 Tax=Saponaria officinalis TaxID=3572 RepID=A0AAW1HQW2_SAPOF